MIIKLLKKIRILYLIHWKWRRFSFGQNFSCGRNVFMWAKREIKIGDNFYIGRYSQIECDALIGDNVMFGNFVSLVGKYDHNYKQIGIPIRLASQIRDFDYNWKGLQTKVVIEDDVWVGFGSIILSGVKISKGSIIAAGSVVTNDVPPYSIFGGNPARFLKYRFSQEEILNHENNLYTKI